MPPTMSSLNNKRIIIGVTGGIAAYKSAELVRRLQDRGASIRVVMTKAAQEFITPLTMQALSGNPVHLDLLDTEAEAAMGHIELARWADLILIAPASADFIARLSTGQGNDLLTTLCLATKAPIAFAPAMNQAMWHNQSTQKNLDTLIERNISQFGPAAGEQACGDIGLGRMLEVEQIIDKAEKLFQTGSLSGKKVVITAGPTREAIDPVRYISNHSSGKMGYALAMAAVDAGAETILISGPTNLADPDRVKVRHINTAEEMYQASLEEITGCDIFIASAAVADFRPQSFTDQKIKKTKDDTMSLELVKNPDIIASISAKSPELFTVGFAAETEDLIANARSKLARKNLDLVIANDVSDTNIGFNSDDNAVILVWPDKQENIEQCSKTQLAKILIARIAKQFSVKTK